MNQLGKLAVLVVGLAFGSVVCAARVELGNVGLYVTLPSPMTTQTTNAQNQIQVLGRGKNDLAFTVQIISNSQEQDKDVFGPGMEERIDSMLSQSVTNIKILAKSIQTRNNVKFREYQFTGSIGGKNTVFMYSLYTTYKSKVIIINVGSDTISLEKNRKNIADIVGSISTKP